MNCGDMGRLSTLGVFAVLGIALAGAARADAAAGRDVARQTCAACHGEAGDKPLQPEYPILSGQHSDYLAKALRDYQTGLRKNPIMAGMAKPLSRKNIQDLAEWFASRPGPLHVKR